MALSYRRSMTDLSYLMDRQNITDLLTRYAAAVDNKDWEAYRKIFTSDATIDYSAVGGAAGNLDEVVAFLTESMALFSASQHMITNEQVAIDRDTATVRAMFLNPMQFAAPEGETGAFFTLGGWYNHELVRTADGWKSNRLVEEFSWSNGM